MLYNDFSGFLSELTFYGMSLTDVGCQLVDLIQGVKPDHRFTEGIRSYLESEYKGKASLVESDK